MNNSEISLAAEIIHQASSLLITVGAGMGVDSGLPDFRGKEGFWKAYPPFRKAGLSFYDLANPKWFKTNPAQAWGFYGHRLNLHRETEPHEGFQILKRWGESKAEGHFVFTSNVDGHFQASGFSPNNVIECHGSFEHLQCSQPCCRRTWQSSETQVQIDESTMLAIEPLPECLNCQHPSRPNILMFGDYDWIDTNCNRQLENYRNWLSQITREKLVVVEIGAGTAVPTVRYESERRTSGAAKRLIRINVRESEGPRQTVSLGSKGLETLRAIDKELSQA